MARFTFGAALLCALAFGPAGSLAHPALVAVNGPVATTQRDGQHDFDFLLGSWKSHYKVLRHPLSGSHDWYEFDGTNVVRPLLHDQGNIEEGNLYRPAGRIDALTLRMYNPATHDWSLYWATVKSGLSIPPQVGRFNAAGVGDFYDNETYAGKPIVVRYHWTHTGRTVWHFEQSFSADGRKTWETNWISDSVARTSG
jgi:hypothetical protein